MGDLDELSRAFLAGLICGVVVSVPVGPVNLTIINRALRRGFLAAFLTGLGAIAAEAIFASLMLTGHSSILRMPSMLKALRVLSVGVIIFIGIRSLLFREERVEAKDAATVEKVDTRWHHPRSFLLGFLLTISNLMLMLLWATLAAALFAHDWVQPELISRTMCVLGVFVGGVLWFFLLAFFVSRAHRRVKPRTLTVLVRSCGVVFLVFAGLLAYRLIAPTKAHRGSDSGLPIVPATKTRGVDLIRRAS